MFYILTDGVPFVHRWFETTDNDLLDQWEEEYAALADDRSELSALFPTDLWEGVRSILQSLLCPDPSQRASVNELIHNKWLIGEKH